MREALNIRPLGPGPVQFANMLDPAHCTNLPTDIVRNRDDPQLSTMAIGCHTELFHNLCQLQVITRNQYSALIEARLSWRRSLWPVGSEVHLLKRIQLAQLT